jgi:hypothetical protein
MTFKPEHEHILRDFKYELWEVKQQLKGAWQLPRPMSATHLVKHPLSSDRVRTIKLFWWACHVAAALSAKVGYPLPTILRVKSYYTDKLEVDLRMRHIGRYVVYKTVLRVDETNRKTRIEVFSSGSKPFYVRKGVIWIPKGQRYYQIKTLAASSTVMGYGQRRGIDPYMIGHKYPK